MEQILIEKREDVARSVLKFDTDSSDIELFLLYSKGRENGPSIERDGMGPPWMIHPNPMYYGLKVTDPDLQRYGTYFISSELQKSDCDRLSDKIARLKSVRKNKNFELIERLEELLESNLKEKNYIDVFKNAYPDYEIVGMQGIGDLTMNLWNVAYVNDRITKEPKMLHLFEEPIHDRLYTCLVKWKEESRKLEIKNVRFNRYEYNDDPKSKWVVQIDNKPVADQIEFAVFGQQMIRPNLYNPNDSEIFEPRELVHQFSDIRHLIQLPNLNPKKNYTSLKGDKGRPRIFFGKPQNGDIWYGESELLNNRNLMKAAINGSVELSRLHDGLGVSEDQVENSLKEAGYSMIENPLKPIQYDEIPIHQDLPNDSRIAEWRFVPEDTTLTEIRLRENRYPCTMLGVNEVGKLYLLAWKGAYSKYPGWTLRQAAYKLLTYNVKSAILCDEGGDVFQFLWSKKHNQLVPVIQPSRGQIRAVFVIARKIKK